jgi:glutamate dehydrogenase
MNGLLREQERAELDAKVQRWVEADVPQALAEWVGRLPLLQGALDVIDIAEHSQRTITQVAEVYFALGDALDLDWLFTQLDQLDGQGSWTARARYSLRYDLEQEYKRLTITLLQTAEAVAAKDVQAWLAARGTAVQRFEQLMQTLHKQPQLDLAAIVLALRELRQL